jgi:hypothetical protein
MIGIAAAGKLNLGGVNSSTQNYFNKGLKNRLYDEITDDPTITTQTTEEQDALKYAESTLKLKKYLNDFTVNQTFPTPGESISFGNTYLRSVLLNVNTDVNYRSVIPINTEITMDGIAGIAIGEVFRINSSMLPKDYNRIDLGFIVTSLKQSVESSNWLTTLGAYVILLGQDELTLNQRNKGLSRSAKEDVLGYQEKYKATKQEELNECRDKYIRILYFISEYFAGNVLVGLDQKLKTVKVDRALAGDQRVNELQAEPVFKPLYINKPIHNSVNYSSILAEWSFLTSDGTFRYMQYGILPTPQELVKKRMGLLDSFIRSGGYVTSTFGNLSLLRNGDFAG